MSASEPVIPLPTAVEKEVQFLAQSGAVVTLRLIDTGLYEVKLDTRTDYTAVLRRTSDDEFALEPAPGVVAVGGTGLSGQELYEGF